METIEFLVTPDGKLYYRKDKGEERRLTRFDKEICSRMLSMIKERFPTAWSRLSTLYPPVNKTHAKQDEAAFKMIERFIRCNFGEHDLLTPDVEKGIMNFEEVRCPLRGICSDENIICKPRGTANLSPGEKKVVKYYLLGYTFKEIAQILKLSPSTVKVTLFKIKNKLKVKNCREIIKTIRQNNIRYED